MELSPENYNKRKDANSFTNENELIIYLKSPEIQ